MDDYNIGNLFGTTHSTTQAEVANANVTLFSANVQPQKISDLYVSSFTAVLVATMASGGRV